MASTLPGRGRRRATPLTTMSRLSRRTRSSCRQPSSAIQSSNRSRSARGACAPHPTVTLTLSRARAASRATAPTDRRCDRPRHATARRAPCRRHCCLRRDDAQRRLRHLVRTRGVGVAPARRRDRRGDALRASLASTSPPRLDAKRPSSSRSRPSHFPHAPATKAVLSITVSSS